MALSLFDVYLPLAQQGDPDAQFRTAVLYLNGQDGAPRDPEEAFAWFWKSAEKGFSPALFNLGGMFFDGIGVEKCLISAYCFMYLGSRDKDTIVPAKVMLEEVVSEMTSQEIAAGQFMAKKWMQEHPKGLLRKSSLKAFFCAPWGHEPEFISSIHALAKCYSNGDGNPKNQGGHIPKHDRHLLTPFVPAEKIHREFFIAHAVVPQVFLYQKKVSAQSNKASFYAGAEMLYCLLHLVDRVAFEKLDKEESRIFSREVEKIAVFEYVSASIRNKETAADLCEELTQQLYDRHRVYTQCRALTGAGPGAMTFVFGHFVHRALGHTDVVIPENNLIGKESISEYIEAMPGLGEGLRITGDVVQAQSRVGVMWTAIENPQATTATLKKILLDSSRP